MVGGIILLVIAIPCVVSLPWTLSNYNEQRAAKGFSYRAPSVKEHFEPFGTDKLGRSMMSRLALGGAISLGIGATAALISVIIGVTWGALAGYIGGRTDAVMMRVVDVLFGLPYILLVVLFALMVNGLIERIELADSEAKRQATEAGLQYASGWLATLVKNYRPLINLAALVAAIGGVSWLTLARVIRGQTLSLRGQTFVEAARAIGAKPRRILMVHLLPNLIGPIIVYTTLTVPVAILQESFLSFLGIGVETPLPSWGNLASDGLSELHKVGDPGVDARWWLFVWPCALLGLTLLALNFLGDALRTRWDPRSTAN